MGSLTRREAAERLTQGRGDGRPPRPAEAFAPANIALCKYWGKRDEDLRLPVTSSLSVSLGPLGTHTRLAPAAGADRFVLNGRPLPPDAPAAGRLARFLDLFRGASGPRFEVDTRNTVPTAAGFASSASGFAALVRALDGAYGWGLGPRELSLLARMGSGSACRSVFTGFVEWHAGARADGMDSFAEPLGTAWPALRVGLLEVEAGEKATGSREGMRRTADSSPLYAAWPATAEHDLAELKAAVAAGDFERLGRTAEGNALAMHATMIAARPALLYWQPGSVEAIRRVQDARAEGVPVYLTMDAGPNLKLLFEAAAEAPVRGRFPGLTVVAPFAAGPAGA